MADPLFRWPGGKRWLAPVIVSSLTEFDRYVEPFLGGGALLFALEPEVAVASDINFDVMNFYMVVRDQPQSLVEALGKLHSDEDSYYWARDHWKPANQLEGAARFIYLIRHSWNGIYRVNRNGAFNVPYSYRKPKRRVELEDLGPARQVLEQVDIRNDDFREVLAEAHHGDVIFLDPPYFSENGETFDRYNSAIFGDEDQRDLASMLQDADNEGVAWILTNGSSTQIRRHYPRYDTFVLSRLSSLAADPRARGHTTEFLALSNSRELDKLREFALKTYPRLT